MKLHSHRRGLGFITVVLNIFAIVVIVYVGFLLVPIYVEHYDVKKILNDIPDKNVLKEHKTSAAALRDIRVYFSKKFRVQQIKSVPLNQIDIVQYMQGYEVRVKYQVRRSVFGNISLVISFNDALKVPVIN